MTETKLGSRCWKRKVEIHNIQHREVCQDCKDPAVEIAPLDASVLGPVIFYRPSLHSEFVHRSYAPATMSEGENFKAYGPDFSFMTIAWDLKTVSRIYAFGVRSSSMPNDGQEPNSYYQSIDAISNLTDLQRQQYLA